MRKTNIERIIVVVRRAYCKECGRKKKAIPARIRKEYERKNPRTKIGEKI